jgi:hypothetical protein
MVALVMPPACAVKRNLGGQTLSAPNDSESLRTQLLTGPHSASEDARERAGVLRHRPH